VFWWLFQGFLYSFIYASDVNSYGLRLAASIVESMAFMVVHICFSYALMYFVIPRYLLKQKYWLTTIWVIIFTILVSALSAVLALTVIPRIHYLIIGVNHPYKGANATTVKIALSLMAGLRGAITVGGIAAAIKLMKYFYIKEQRNAQLQKENVEAQLQILKGQIHPHFLFNTLNNIYSYTQQTSSTASTLVLGLSDMLRYMLYECNQPLVPLSKEIKMVQDYMALEMIRYDDQWLDIHVHLPANDDQLYIAPLILLPFIENSFKHGTSTMLEQPWINLDIEIRENTLFMKLMNGKPSRQSPGHQPGIGTSNVRQRLDLLYEHRYILTIQDEEDVFIVNLELELETKETYKKTPVL
jgi:sensor histidine kinase YesM